MANKQINFAPVEPDSQKRRFAIGCRLFEHYAKMGTEHMRFTTFIIILLPMFFAATVSANSFSCPYGKQGACLDYNDKVCSSYSKCVNQNSTCFQPNTCGYGGFICKSEYSNLSNEYDDLLRKCKNIASEHDDLVDKYNRLLRNYQDAESCVSYASSLEEAQSCM